MTIIISGVTQPKILEVNPVSRGCLDGNRNDSNPCDDPSFAAICPLGVETRQNISRWSREREMAYIEHIFWLIMSFVAKTSQELRMLSSVTFNCQVRMIGWIQVLNCQNCNQCLKCQVSRTVFPIVKNCLNYQNCPKLSHLSKLSKIVKKLSKLS